MDSDSIRSIIAIVVLVLFSAFFSATETAFSALNRIRIKSLAEGGSKKAQLVKKLSDDYDKLLSTILVGNNLVNIAATSISTLLFVKLFQKNGATISTVVITVLVLIFGEISPKSLAKESPEKFAMFAAPFLRVLVFLLTPVNFVFTQWKRLLKKLFKTGGDRGMTEEELLTMVDEAEQDGAIEEGDRQLINSVMEFNDSVASEILTPRVDISAVRTDSSQEDISAMFVDTGYSRLPVYEGSIDSIIGVIHLRDFFDLVINNKRQLSDIIQSPVFIAPNTKISDLLALLQRAKSHMAVVTDEYGGTMGIITMEDILEELVGEIWDEHDEIIEEFVCIEDGVYKIVCSADLDKLIEYFDLTGEFDSSTVSGWIMEQLGKIPEENDTFEYDGLAVTVLKTDHHRALECIIRTEKAVAI